VAVKESLKQMDGSGPMHKPVIGRLALAGMRTAMGTVNHLPAVKRRMVAAEASFRDQDRED
jgi:hypothetical protein